MTYREPAKPVPERPASKHQTDMGICDGWYWYVAFPSHDPPNGYRGVGAYICDGCGHLLSPSAYAAGAQRMVPR